MDDSILHVASSLLPTGPWLWPHRGHELASSSLPYMRARAHEEDRVEHLWGVRLSSQSAEGQGRALVVESACARARERGPVETQLVLVLTA
jgi:hypothetical protein